MLVKDDIIVPHSNMRNVVQKMDRHIPCPNCNFRRHYQLADGRRKCKRCAKKFTLKQQFGRLQDRKVQEIVRMFWLLVPATRVATDIGLNSKTVQRYYHLLRQKIAAESDRDRPVLAGEIEVDESYFGGVQKGKRGRGAGGKISVFGLLKRKGRVVVMIPQRVTKPSLQGAIKEYVQPQSIVFSDSFRAYENLDLEGFHHVRIDHSQIFATGKAHINGIENFWGFAKRRLKLYHGGYKKNFYLFLKEMEFRFNHRNDNNVTDLLWNLLKSGPI